MDEARTPSVGIVGAGALGCLFGALLHEAGLSVMLVSRRQDVVARIERDGITVHDQSIDRGESMLQRPMVAHVDDATGPFDAVILVNKSFDTEWAVGVAQRLVAEDGVILSMQNGLRSVELVEGAERGVVGTTYQGAGYLDGGSIVWSVAGPTLVAPRDYLRAATHSLVRATERSRLPIEIAADRAVMVWTKLIAAVSNSVSGALLIPVADALWSDRVWDVMDQARAEAFDVAERLGVSLDRAAMEARLAARPRTAGRGTIGSTFQSLASGRSTEVADISGAIVQAAEHVGLAAPVNETLDLLVAAREELARR